MKRENAARRTLFLADAAKHRSYVAQTRKLVESVKKHINTVKRIQKLCKARQRADNEPSDTVNRLVTTDLGTLLKKIEKRSEDIFSSKNKAPSSFDYAFISNESKQLSFHVKKVNQQLGAIINAESRSDHPNRKLQVPIELLKPFFDCQVLIQLPPFLQFTAKSRKQVPDDDHSKIQTVDLIKG